MVADGPRADRPDDIEKCKAARAVIEGVDWDCEVLTNYSDLNLGCKKRVSSGLDWVFEIVEEAIILEDDCLPHPSFFRFCQGLLDYYRNDKRIMAISGDNFQLGRKRTEYSYYFSRYNHIWGWATWRRAWQYYDVKMKLWQEVRDGNWLESILGETQAMKYWRKIFQTAYDNKVDTWDYPWTFACWIQNGLTILPNQNLVSNIGFGEGATHTVNSVHLLANIPVKAMIFPLKHPPFIMRDTIFDSFSQKNIFQRNRIVTVREKLRNKLQSWN